ncbi:unnamed protein product [Schistosoma bovis]|nr:unnamed protein product [Schistosoma bovis]
MSHERQSNSTISNPSLSGLALNLSQASIPTGPILLPAFISHGADELSSFIGENPVNTKTSIPESEEKSLDSGSSLAKNTLILEVSPPSACSFKPIASTTVKLNQRPRYVLPPDINTFSTSTPTSITNIPLNSPIKPSSTFRPNQLLPPFLPSNPQNNIQTAQLPVFMETTDQQTQCPNQNIDPTSSISSSVLMRTTYHPVGAHWFYSTTFENISVWWPFSRHDSYQIETEFFRSCYSQFTSENSLASPITNTTSDMKATIGTREVVVQVDGGRYDVHLTKRERRSVYWDESPGQVRRATWFYKPQGESRVLPFSERTCDLLEAQYKLSVEQGQWGKRFDLPSEDKRGGSDVFIFNSPQSMIQYLAWPYDLSSTTNSGNVVAGTSSPFIHLDPSQISQEMSLTGQLFEGRVCYLHRGLNEQLMEQIDEGDYKPIDQLFFIVHGIGSIYNLKGQGLIECVNDMRNTAKQLSQTHFPHHPYRMEFLPILWHDELHSDTVTGLDKQLEQITLGSIPKLRQFTNDSLMDILFYTSSKYSQLIVNTVAREITRLRELFISRNPNFTQKSVLIPHHKGRKRIHLQLKDNLAWVGSELKSKFYNSVQSTWRSLHEFALAHKFISASGELGSGSTAYTCGNSSNGDELDDYENVCNLTDNRNDVVTTTYRNLTTHDLSFNSRLNQGRRIDYVLQEAALESFNEYLFALTSHGTYWDSVDTVLFILTEAYSEKGIAPIMPGQKNVPENTIHVRALSPLTSAGSTSVHSMLNPSSVTADLLVNVNNDHQMPASQQVDHLVSLSSVNQNQPYPITTTVASTVSSISRISNIQGQLPPSLPYITPPPVILATTTNNNTHYMQTTVTDSYYQVAISQHYSSAGPPSSHIFSQKYIAPQISVCMSQEFSNTAGNYMQTQKQQQYSNIPAYAHRKQSSVNNSTTSSFTPSIPPFHSATPPTSCISVDHPICVVPSIIPDLLCTPTNIFIPTSTVMENTFCSSSQMFPPVSQ